MASTTESGHFPRESTGVPTGRLGIWCFLASEIVIFGGLIFCYILFRWRHPEWAAEAAHMLEAAGAFNTLVLLTSSWMMVRAQAAVERRDFGAAVRNLGFTLLGGGIFMTVKTYEYSHEILAGYVPAKSLFWSFYYAITGLHALHLLGGMVAIAIVLFAIRRGREPQRVEYVGMYWHFVDIVWIFVFTLLYLAS
jgi:heme/copper-type cytochrome/quinol oxidase subunit 3